MDKKTIVMKHPLVNIVLVTYNQFKFVPDCIESVLACNYKNIKFYLVDNNSEKNGYESFCSKFRSNKNITFYRLEKNIGFPGACNYALKNIKKGYIVFLNDDTIVTKDWLNPIISYMEKNPDVGACQPKIKNMRKKNYFEYAGAAGGCMDVYGFPFCRGRIFFTAEKDYGQYDKVTRLVWCSGACMITKAEVLKKVGFFDDIFFIYGDESDLCWRMHFYGYKLMYIPTSTIYHYGSGTMDRQPYKKIYLHHRNGIILLFKNYTAIELVQYLPIRIFFDFCAFWFYILKSRIFMNALAIPLAYINLLYLTPQLLKRRRFAAFKIKKKGIERYPLYRGSIVLDYFLLRKRKYSQLERNE